MRFPRCRVSADDFFAQCQYFLSWSLPGSAYRILTVVISLIPFGIDKMQHLLLWTYVVTGPLASSLSEQSSVS
jgi:hypothetical protein